MQDKVICAVCTASGRGGVAIIRLSGEGALSIAEKMFEPAGKTAVKDFSPRVMYSGKIICGGFEDFGFCVFFRAPKSFTGEDIVEFHCHGGVHIARGVYKAALDNGAYPAERGEFTKRAFLNGKLTLSSAEGMVDMINAESLAEIRAGHMLYTEKLSDAVSSLRAELTDILASVAADVDFPEEDIERDELSTVKERLEAVREKIAAAVSGYRTGKKIKSGVTVALCGAPNVGKSSLLNALLGYDKAIVSSQAGTTRDAVEGQIEIDGVKYNLIDTAGIRERAGEIEKEGIARAEKIIKSADIVLSVRDDENGYAQTDGAEVIKILNKCDISSDERDYDICVSAVRGDGLEELKKLISQKAMSGYSSEQAYVIEERHFSALSRAEKSLSSAVAAAGLYPIDIVSLDITDAWTALGEITGDTATEEIIDTVFAKFCVGK